MGATFGLDHLEQAGNQAFNKHLVMQKVVAHGCIIINAKIAEAQSAQSVYECSRTCLDTQQ
jgi:hypothetical protein